MNIKALAVQGNNWRLFVVIGLRGHIETNQPALNCQSGSTAQHRSYGKRLLGWRRCLGLL